MSSRPGILVTIKVPFESMPPPNQMVDRITVEIRAHWPSNAEPGDVLPHLTTLAMEAQNAIRAKMAEPTYEKVWLMGPEDPEAPPPSPPQPTEPADFD